MPGEYTITAELLLPNKTKITSNRTTIEILPPHKEWEKRVILAKPGIARLLYYRTAGPRSSDLRKLVDYRANSKRDPNAGMIDYTLGRIYANIAEGYKTKNSRVKYEKLATNHLKKAYNNKYTGSNARRIAGNIIDELKS